MIERRRGCVRELRRISNKRDASSPGREAKPQQRKRGTREEGKRGRGEEGVYL
jgi:hypothetical protein